MATVGDENDPTTGGSDMSVPTVAERSVSAFGEVTLPMPPQEGFTADDLDRIPDLPPHAELIDGSLVLVSPQKRFHMLMLKLLEQQLDDQVPSDLSVYREFTLKLGEKQRPEPDLMLVGEEVSEGMDSTWIGPEPVHLTVEVVSPESAIRDRERKPQLYAEAGIPHFWLVDRDDKGPVVYVYELDPVNKRYTNVSVHRERLEVSVPCKLDIDLTKLPRH
ncbi:Uma2 family endonuclease [Nocardiopsis aegyptia]|nr:Uma2 family endonuclease [Nocardiopsis aegyptia]